MTMPDPDQTPEVLKRLVDALLVEADADEISEKRWLNDRAKKTRAAAAAISALMAERDALKATVDALRARLAQRSFDTYGSTTGKSRIGGGPSDI